MNKIQIIIFFLSISQIAISQISNYNQSIVNKFIENGDFEFGHSYYDEALSEYTKALEFYTKINSDQKDTQYAFILFKQAECLFMLDKATEAITKAEQAKNIILQNTGRESIDYVTVLSELATYYYYSQATENANEKVLEYTNELYYLAKTPWGKKNLNMSFCADIYNKINPADEKVFECYTYASRTSDKNTIDYVSALIGIANYYNITGFYDKAKKYINKAHETYIKHVNKFEYIRNSTVENAMLKVEGLIMQNEGNYNEAAELFMQIVESYNETKEISTYLESLFMYINCLYSSNEYIISPIQTGFENSSIKQHNLTLAEYYTNQFQEQYEQLIDSGYPITQVYWEAEMILANIHNFKGEYDEALKCLFAFKEKLEEFGYYEHYLYTVCLMMIANNLSDMHKYDEALQYQLAATQLTEKLYGKDDEFYLNQISLLSDYYFIVEYTNLYYETCKEILTLSEKLYGSDSEQYAYALGNLSDYYSSLGLGTSGAKKALEYALEAVEILYKIHNKVPLYVEKNLFWLYLQLDDKEEAYRLIKSIIKNTQKFYGNDSQEYADCLLCLSFTKEDEEEAKLLLDKSLQIIINQFGTDSKEYLEFLEKINDEESNDSIRLSNALIIKDLTEKFYGKNSEDYAATLLDLTKILAYKNPQAAIKTLNKATQIYTTFDKNRMSYIKQYLLTAIELHFLLGNDVVAYELNNEAMELLKNLNPMYKESSTYFALLRNLAYYKNHIGEYEQTPEILLELINIEEKLGITQHDDIMLLFADTYTLLGKYEEATRIYNELYECIIQDETRFTKEYSTIADGMSSLYENLGDYDKSLFYAIESYKSSNDISTKGYELSQIGNIHYKLGNFKKAIEYLDIAIDTETKVYGKVTSVEIYHIKGEIYYKTKNYEEALRQYMLAKENIETQLGTENLNYAKTLISIAKIHIKLNEYQTATNYRNQAKEIIYKMNSGSKKYNYISALCAIDYDLNDEVSLKEDFQTVTDNYTKIIKTNFQNLSANERTLFWENYKDWFEEQSPKFAYTYNAQEFSTNAQFRSYQQRLAFEFRNRIQ